MKCEICGDEEVPPTHMHISEKVSMRCYNEKRSLCSKCHQKENKVSHRGGGFPIVRRVIDSKNYKEYTWAYSELRDIILEVEREQGRLLHKIKKLETEKQTYSWYMEILTGLADDDPKLRYEFARKEADSAISNKKLRGRVMKRDKSRCVYCGATENLTIDHIKPVLLGGSNSIENLQVLCRSCNSSKGAKWEGEIYEQRMD